MDCAMIAMLIAIAARFATSADASAAVPAAASSAPPSSFAAAAVHDVRLNAQRPNWSNVCPPPEDDAAGHGQLEPSAGASSVSPPCTNAAESQGLPTSGLRLTWELRATAGQRALVQHGYEAEIIRLATGKSLWSGNATIADFTTVALPEPELPSESSFAARVRVSWVSAAGGGSAPAWTDWSAPALFDTAPSSGSWAARDSQWIGGHNQLRTAFSLPSGSATVSRARLYAIGLGSFVVSMNGQRVGDHLLDPPQTAYPSRALFSSYNVTQRLRAGGNVIGVLLGRYKYGYMDVWCNLTAAGHKENACRSFRMQLVVQFSDGSVLAHVSSSRPTVADWYGRQGPIVYDHEYHGEQYDSRIGLVGWDDLPHSSFSEDTWQPVVAVPAVRVQDAVLSPVQMPPVRMVESRKAVSIWKLDHAPGTTVVSCNASSGRIGGEIAEGQFDDSTLNLTCLPGSGKISKILFANFGTGKMAPDCSQGILGGCAGANSSLAVVEKLCLDKTSCQIAPRVGQFGTVDPCPDIKKTLVVLASGCTPEPAPPQPKLPASETSYVYDFGQNVAGFTSVHAQGPAGKKLYTRHAETLAGIPSADMPFAVANGYCTNNAYRPGTPQDTGCHDCAAFVGSGANAAYASIWGGNCANQTNLFVLNGSGGVEHHRPEFMYAGFRFVQLWGLPEGVEPTTQTLVQHFVHSDVPEVGVVHLPRTVASPNGTPDVLNRVQSATVYAQRSNLMSIPTDCPQRERRGWSVTQTWDTSLLLCCPL
jgi:hypothetical protein